ncbi:MAG: hypothetical protein IJI71_01000, partial [Clostridia bacterium]|nr:hypothetical protein [Clostridia bacterium]
MCIQCKAIPGTVFSAVPGTLRKKSVEQSAEAEHAERGEQHVDGHVRHRKQEQILEHLVVLLVGRSEERTDPGELVLPAPDVVLVDEADSVLVDEARVPLVLAGAAEGAEGDPLVAEVVRGLRPDEHYEVDAEGRNVHLNDAGLERVERALGEEDLYAPGRGHRLSQVHVALHAHALLRRDVDYLVRDGRVELIDDSRGRVALLQRWPDGLQAAVEAKEG